jgi:ubiquitin-protein ligase
MKYYTVIESNSINLNLIESSLYDWKLNNLITYIDNLTYINDEYITLSISINEKVFKFEIKNNKLWILTVLLKEDTINKIELKIFEMVNYINNKYSEFNYNNILNKILDIIENTIEEYEFDDEDSNDEFDDSNCSLKSETNKIIYKTETIDETVNIIDNNYFHDSEIEDIKSISSENSNNSDDYSDEDFKLFIENLNETNSMNINYIKLKEDALKYIVSLSDSSLKKTLFNPQQTVYIIINEIKQLEKMYELIINDIYNFQIKYYSEILKTNIIIQIILNTVEYPSSPPKVYIIKPIMTDNINHLIRAMNYFKLENWNPINSLLNMINELVKLIDQYFTVLNIDGTYTKLLYHLIELSEISKLKPKLEPIFNDNLFQLKFIKYDDDKKPTIKPKEFWKEGTGYGSKDSSNWNIKEFLESDISKRGKLDDLILLIFKEINKSKTEEIKKFQLEEIKDSCLIEHIVNSLINYITDIVNIDKNKNHVTNIINLSNAILEFDSEIFNNYIKLFDDSIKSINVIYKTDKHDDIINSLYLLFKRIIKDKKIIDTTNHTEYDRVMRPLQVSFVGNLPNNLIDKSGKHCKLSGNPRRIGMELASIQRDLPTNIFVITDEKYMRSINVLIIPSDGTPYAHGCFVFHIELPVTYPKDPPLVELITTGGGQIRFNPNLYANGKVCLSLLGTWKGNNSESWNESTSTILQVLMSILAFIFVHNPFFNEPGYEKIIDTVEGKKKSSDYNNYIQYNTLCYAMIDMIKNPPYGFQEIIKNHFKLKKDQILIETNEWLKSSHNKAEFNKKYIELQVLLDKL